MHYYLYARFVPTLTDDAPLFDRLIERILASDSSADARFTAINEIAKRKARSLKANRDEYFF